MVAIGETGTGHESKGKKDSLPSGNMIRVKVKNNELDYITLLKFKDHPKDPYYLRFSNTMLFTGTLGKNDFYQGPYAIAEYRDLGVWDTIFKHEEKIYHLDSTVPIIDSTDFLLFSLDLGASYFDSLNQLQPVFLKTKFSTKQLKHPFVVFHITNELIFTDTTNAFAEKKSLFIK